MSKTVNLTDEWRDIIRWTMRDEFPLGAECVLRLVDWLPCARSYGYRLVHEAVKEGFLRIDPRDSSASPNGLGVVRLSEDTE